MCSLPEALAYPLEERVQDDAQRVALRVKSSRPSNIGPTKSAAGSGAPVMGRGYLKLGLAST